MGDPGATPTRGRGWLGLTLGPGPMPLGRSEPAL
jgi:hypothetical protein